MGCETNGLYALICWVLSPAKQRLWGQGGTALGDAPLLLSTFFFWLGPGVASFDPSTFEVEVVWGQQDWLHKTTLVGCLADGCHST